MKITVEKKLTKTIKKADYLILPFLETKKGPLPLFKEKNNQKHFKVPINKKDFLAKENQMQIIYGENQERILLLGLGIADKIDIHKIKDIYATCFSFLKKQKAQSLNIKMPEDLNIANDDLTHSITQCLILTNYSFDKFKNITKKDQPSTLKEATLIGLDKKDLSIIKKAKIIATGVNLTRDLVNNNADIETPQNLSKVAKSFEKISKNIKVTIFDKKRIEKEKMGLLLAVNSGSNKDPAFIIVEYIGDPNSKDLSVLVGKGITYDTGGLSLKPSPSMETMKSDMSGGAAVLGVMHTIASLNLKINVTGIVPATENAIGPASYKVGDVYKGMSNITVEVKNTDAEGRLILADGLSYAAEKLKPNRIIDIASLTGACVVALGEDISALFSNSEELAKMLQDASKNTHDHLWRLPLFKKYNEHLKSDIADLKNIGNAREAGTITAALFLQNFVKNISWAHIDIAGASFITKLSSINPTHATGAGVNLLVNFFENLEQSNKSGS